MIGKRIATLLVATLVALFGVTAVSAPAKADSLSELQAGCDSNWAQMGSAGYYYAVNGVEYGVMITVGWQYVGGSSSNCEDINTSPNTYGGYFMTSAYARTYMCNSSGSCWHNAWRWCGGGCVAATDMANGTKYQVHVAFISVGTDYLLLQD